MIDVNKIRGLIVNRNLQEVINLLSSESSLNGDYRLISNKNSLQSITSQFSAGLVTHESYLAVLNQISESLLQIGDDHLSNKNLKRNFLEINEQNKMITLDTLNPSSMNPSSFLLHLRRTDSYFRVKCSGELTLDFVAKEIGRWVYPQLPIDKYEWRLEMEDGRELIYEMPVVWNKLLKENDVVNLTSILVNDSRERIDSIHQNSTPKKVLIPPNKNFTGKDLSEVEFHLANLEGANFTKAVLHKTSFYKAKLQYSNFRWADLFFANFSKAVLHRTTFYKAKLQYSNFRWADLFFANLQLADLRWSDLSGAELGYTNLQEINLEEAILVGTKLQRTNLTKANLQGANLQRANLEGANLQGANLQGANLEGANLQGTNLQGANLWKTNLWGTNMQKT